MDVIQEDLSARYPDAYVKVKRYNIMFKKYPIEVQFSGPDPAVLHRLADSARMIMARTPQVAQITTGWEPAVPVLAVDYHQAAARRANLSRQMYGGRRLAHRQSGERTRFPDAPECKCAA